MDTPAATPPRILFVDDDANLLDAVRRQLRKHLPLATAESGAAALELLEQDGPFAVVVSDMRMPHMNGVELLAEVSRRWPRIIRVMLTGNADLQTAVEAVNEGHIFRFLTKPCEGEVLIRALHQALEQYRLVHAERMLLEQTLAGCVRAISEILSLVNPTAFSRAARIRGYVRHMAEKMELPDLWKYEVAAMLSQIGCVTLPTSVLNKLYLRRELLPKENRMYRAHPQVARTLLDKVPRLEDVALMVEGQMDDYAGAEALAALDEPDRMIARGAQILRVALDFDQYIARAISPAGALAGLQRKAHHYDPDVLAALEDFQPETVQCEVRAVTVEELETGMVTDEHIRSAKGALLVPAGHEVTFTTLERLRNFSSGGIGLRQPFRVRVPMDAESLCQAPAIE